MKNIVSIHTHDNVAHVWTRDGFDVKEYTFDFHPWLILPYVMSDYRSIYKRIRFQGDGINYFYQFKDAEAFDFYARKNPHKRSMCLKDFNQQFLTMNPEYHLFQDMKFSNLRRLTIDIESTGKDPEKDKILMIGTSLGPIIGTEEEMLEDLIYMIKDYDPDTIEGWNIFSFDLPFILKRIEKTFGPGNMLDWGRNDFYTYQADYTRNFRVGSFTIPVTPIIIPGRHVIDGMLTAMRYDTGIGGKFPSYSLKEVAKVMGVAPKDRVYIEHQDINDTWKNDRDSLIKYCMDDIVETDKLVELMVQPEFYLASMIPDTFQNICLSGGATRINQIMVEEYVNARQAIPFAGSERPEFAGGFVECLEKGYFENVAKVDVSSLYPSIMLSLPVNPPNDTIGVFHETLQKLTTKRLHYKTLAKDSKFESDKAYYTGIEKAYKTLINSYYGYLGANMNWSDYKAAARITETGRDIVKGMAAQLMLLGYKVIEIDTDGIYFQYEPGDDIESIPHILDLPKGIAVDIDTEYTAMLSVKAKNYVLIAKDGEIKYHGNSLRSRRDEVLFKEFIRELVNCFRINEPDLIETIYKQFQESIINKDITPEEIARRERISDKTMNSPLKAKLKDAVDQTDLEEGEYIYVYQASDSTYKPIEMYNNDEDTFHYLERLYKVGQRFQELWEQMGISLPRMPKKVFKTIMGVKNDSSNNDTS